MSALYQTDTDFLQRRAALRVLFGGMLGMMVVMGIGRFAFTPIIPLMQRDLAISNSLAGGLASLNYVGYLAGALVCAFWPQILRKNILNLLTLLTCILTTFLMGLTQSVILWGVLRLLAGYVSAVLFVAIAVEVSERLVEYGYSRFGSALYGGIGLGIAFSGVMVPVMDWLGGWSFTWLAMGGFSLLLSAAGVMVAGKRTAALQVANKNSATESKQGRTGKLATAYFLEGFGYIISGTFLVTMIANTPGLSGFAPYSWVVAGVAAAPSTILWQLFALRVGTHQALITAYLVQAGGLFLSINANTMFQAGLAAIIFGGTFLGIVALVMSEGARRSGKNSSRVAAILTACFGGGQVIGPQLAGILADLKGDFTLPLLMAALAILVAAALIATDKGFQKAPIKSNI
jgi:predicted MFS family arabinose efflux permease